MNFEIGFDFEFDLSSFIKCGAPGHAAMLNPEGRKAKNIKSSFVKLITDFYDDSILSGWFFQLDFDQKEFSRPNCCIFLKDAASLKDEEKMSGSNV